MVALVLVVAVLTAARLGYLYRSHIDHQSRILTRLQN